MLVLFDHQCECGHIFEELVERGATQRVVCPNCKSLETVRILSPIRLNPAMGVDATGFPTMGDKWVRTRRQHQLIEERRKREHGD